MVCGCPLWMAIEKGCTHSRGLDKCSEHWPVQGSVLSPSIHPSLCRADKGLSLCSYTLPSLTHSPYRHPHLLLLIHPLPLHPCSVTDRCLHPRVSQRAGSENPDPPLAHHSPSSQCLLYAELWSAALYITFTQYQSLSPTHLLLMPCLGECLHRSRSLSMTEYLWSAHSKPCTHFHTAYCMKNRENSYYMNYA